MSRRLSALIVIALTPGCGNSCFVDGTEVATDRGLVPIERVSVGDRVVSVNPATGEQALKRVTRVHGRRGAEVYRVQVGDATIEGVTEDHPFWCQTEQAWREVGELELGHDLLVRSDAGFLRAQTLRSVAEVPGRHKVQTLTVEGPWHTFVAEGVVVHNKSSYFTSSTGTPSGSDTVDSGPDKEPPGLRIRTATMDMAFGWDGTEVVDYKPPSASVPQSAYFVINLGGADWPGDTGVPGAPNTWCFVRYNLNGQLNDPSDPNFALNLIAGLDPNGGRTNCGQESAPGADDRVTMDGSFFGGGDPVAQMAPLAWTFHFGGPLANSVADVPSFFTTVQPENFWGSQVRSDLFGSIDTLTYGWQIDAEGNIVEDANGDSVLHTNPEWVGPSGPEPGMYRHYVPWLFYL